MNNHNHNPHIIQIKLFRLYHENLHHNLTNKQHCIILARYTVGFVVIKLYTDVNITGQVPVGSCIMKT